MFGEFFQVADERDVDVALVCREQRRDCMFRLRTREMSMGVHEYGEFCLCAADTHDTSWVQ